MDRSAAWRRSAFGVGVSYAEGVRELSPGWRLCGTLGQVFLRDLPCRGNRFSAGSGPVCD